MNRKVETMKVSGGAEYAKVPARLKLFREDCPNGDIQTEYTIDDGVIIFKAIAIKDKRKAESAKATGHSYGKLGQAKAFEKLETQSVGRALALLGYLASGEVASAEEMQDFYDYQNQKVDEAVNLLADSKTLDELKSNFMSLGPLIAEAKVVDAKDQRKKELTNNESN